MRLRGSDEIRGMDIVEPDGDLLVVTEKGFAKRTPLEEYNVQKRNGSGVRTISKDMIKTGKIIAARVVSDDGDITLISKEGIMLRTRLKDIPTYSRATRGVTVMNLKRDDVVASAAVLAPKQQADSGETSDQGEEQGPDQAATAVTSSDIPTNGQGD